MISVRHYKIIFFQLFEKYLIRNLNFLFRTWLFNLFVKKLILLTILSFELTKKILVSELPISPKIYIIFIFVIFHFMKFNWIDLLKNFFLFTNYFIFRNFFQLNRKDLLLDNLLILGFLTKLIPIPTIKYFL